MMAVEDNEEEGVNLRRAVSTFKYEEGLHKGVMCEVFNGVGCLRLVLG
jgi:hypothetical protein